MSQLPETATVVRLSSVAPELASRKLRVAGRLIKYVEESSLLLIADEENALFVDVSLCLSPWQSYPWLQESNSIVCALGYLEQLQDSIPLPTLPYHAPRTAVDPYLVLSAVILEHQPDLDLVFWNRVAERTEILRLKAAVEHQSTPAAASSTAKSAVAASTVKTQATEGARSTGRATHKRPSQEARPMSKRKSKPGRYAQASDI